MQENPTNQLTNKSRLRYKPFQLDELYLATKISFVSFPEILKWVDDNRERNGVLPVQVRFEKESVIKSLWNLLLLRSQVYKVRASVNKLLTLSPPHLRTECRTRYKKPNRRGQKQSFREIYYTLSFAGQAHCPALNKYRHIP